MNRMWMGAALVAALVLSACDDLGDFERAKEDFHYSYPLQPKGELDLDNTNGSVDISGWDRNMIDISGTKFASSSDRLKDIHIKIDVNENHASIRTESPGSFLHGSYGVRYTIRVPREIKLRRAQTTNGSFSIEDLEGGGHLESTNGRISLARNTGEYQVQTTNGSIQFQECSGSERAETTNGGISGRLREGAIDARSTNGSIDLTVEKPRDDQAIRASTVNGGIMLTLPEFHRNPLKVETTHGSITLRLPSNIDARLSAQSTLSRITSEIALTSTEEASKHRLAGQLRNGGPLISAATTTGSIRLEHY